MFLKAGALSLALLLVSRLLGLLRESALAAAFGASGLGDVAVLMLTLPDWVAGVLASGALAYVLLPHWAQQTPAQQAQVQHRVAWALLGGGLLIGCLLAVGQAQVVGWLAAGVKASALPDAGRALLWSALGLPAALLAALWVTRLQHESDFIGMYGANVVVNGAVIAGLGVMAWGDLPFTRVTQLGWALCVALGLRLLWLQWRLRPLSSSVAAAPGTAKLPASQRWLPRPSLWLWAALSAGLPLTLPFVARAMASGAGAGALATFNYAWKLVELPLMLAIQLVATLAFPAITRAMAGGAPRGSTASMMTPEARRVIRNAFALAWTLACAATLALQVGAAAIADLLFGWGRMDAQALARVADWGRVGAWGLLPQALIAVAVTVLAAQARMRVAVAAYALALTGLLALCRQGDDGAVLMTALNGVLTGVALLMLLTLVWRDGRKATSSEALPDASFQAAGLLPWRALAVPAVVLGGTTVALQSAGLHLHSQKGLVPLILSGLLAIFTVALSTLTCPELRQALRR